MSHYLGFIRSTMYNLYQLGNRLSTFRHLKKFSLWHNKTVTIISKIHVICNLIPQSFSRLPCNQTWCVNYESHLTKSLSECSLAEHLFDIYMLLDEQIIKVYTITSYCSSFTTLILGGYRLHIFNSSLYIVLHKLSSCILLDRRFPIQLTN